MAVVRIIHTWPGDGGMTQLEVHTESDYPDALAEGLATVVKLWRETCCQTDEL